MPGASRDDWKTEAIQDPVQITPPERVWTNDEWATIRKGLVPGSMDDRWFAYAEGDTVHAFRSWSGMGIFKARFEQTADGWVIVEAVAEHGHEDRGMLEMVVELILKGSSDDEWRFR